MTRLFQNRGDPYYALLYRSSYLHIISANLYMLLINFRWAYYACKTHTL